MMIVRSVVCKLTNFLLCLLPYISYINSYSIPYHWKML